MLQSGPAHAVEQVPAERYRRGVRVPTVALGTQREGADAGAVAAERESSEEASGASRYWEWKEGWRIHYTEAGPSDGVPVVLLSGFGIGAGTHYARNVEALVSGGHRVFTMDYMGQGKSWPMRDPAPGGEMDREGFQWGFGPAADDAIGGAALTFSCTLWAEQVHAFLRQVVGAPAFLAGNSLGGYVSVMLASQHPEEVRGLFLINPTPVWGVGPQRLLPYAGGYPIPAWIRGYAARYWDAIRDPATIRSMLDMVYADGARVGDSLVQAIQAPTRAPAAASAFASILCAPPSPVPFAKMVETVRDGGTPIALCYGKEDPWILPLWGHRAKRLLPASPYWEISPAGHCPHHEAPEAVNMLFTRWLAEVMAGRGGSLDAVLPPGTTLAVPGRSDLYARSASAPPAFSVSACTGEARSLWEALDDLVARFSA